MRRHSEAAACAAKLVANRDHQNTPETGATSSPVVSSGVSLLRKGVD